MRWRLYRALLWLIPIWFLMSVGLKTLLGWWTGDWKSALMQAIGFPVMIAVLLEDHIRKSERKEKSTPQEDKVA